MASLCCQVRDFVVVLRLCHPAAAAGLTFTGEDRRCAQKWKVKIKAFLIVKKRDSGSFLTNGLVTGRWLTRSERLPQP